ncbi:hypothetical protein P691DRAFT_307061 [Macrolepiota fuliginosa MF-IS2]|uniref:Uncharacterized protein n=1 Tax=Macrolepiota fuliginosa MF-IS2 TaxID=1400762 RepID=A0A9P5X591_9AGAR|nr:hypothetical protein P691DRAFT_307061 [Macrolepiota fuliginosa MF-IS2]
MLRSSATSPLHQKNSMHLPSRLSCNLNPMDTATTRPSQLSHRSSTSISRPSPVPVEDEFKVTCFYRWHIDAVLYDLNPPKVTTHCGLKVLKGDP